MIVTLNVQNQSQTAEKVTGTVVVGDEKCLLFLLTTLCQSRKQTEGFVGKIKIS